MIPISNPLWLPQIWSNINSPHQWKRIWQVQILNHCSLVSQQQISVTGWYFFRFWIPLSICLVVDWWTGDGGLRLPGAVVTCNTTIVRMTVTCPRIVFHRLGWKACHIWPEKRFHGLDRVRWTAPSNCFIILISRLSAIPNFFEEKYRFIAWKQGRSFISNLGTVSAFQKDYVRCRGNFWSYPLPGLRSYSVFGIPSKRSVGKGEGGFWPKTSLKGLYTVISHVYNSAFSQRRCRKVYKNNRRLLVSAQSNEAQPPWSGNEWVWYSNTDEESWYKVAPRIVERESL